MFYQNLIREFAPDADVRHVEAYMRVAHSTLDHLTRDAFREEVKVALNCISIGGPVMAERLALSYGL